MVTSGTVAGFRAPRPNRLTLGAPAGTGQVAVGGRAQMTDRAAGSASRQVTGHPAAQGAAALGTKQPNVACLERGGVDPKHVSLARCAGLVVWRITLEPLLEPAPRGARAGPRCRRSSGG